MRLLDVSLLGGILFVQRPPSISKHASVFGPPPHPGTRSYGQYGGRGGFDSIASCCDQLGYLWGNNPMTGAKDPKLGAQGKAKCLENAKKEYGANTPQAFKPGNPSEKFNILWPSCYLVNPKNKGQCMAAGYGEGLGDTGNLCDTAPGNKYSAISKTKQGGWGSLEECCAGTFKGKPAEVKACQAESRKAWPYAVHTYSDSVPKGVRATMQYEAQAGSAKELTAMATADGLKLAALGCKGDDEWVRKTFPEDVGKLAAC